MKTLSEIISDKSFMIRVDDYKRDDLQRVQSEAVNMDISLSLQDCLVIWEEWSDKHDAQWLSTSDGDPEAIHDAIRSYIESRVKPI